MNTKIVFISAFFLAFHCLVTAQTSSDDKYVNELLAKNKKGFSYTKGTFSVSEFGNAVYDFPIASVPGAAGLVPKISLVYNSSSGTGLLGESWQLGGFSQITRAARNYSIDSVYKGIDFSESDRLNLDGQRLMSLSDEYWPNNTTTIEFRTEIHTPRRIRAFDDNDDNGIDRFEVFTKDGLIYHYGKFSKTSKAYYLLDASKKSIISWLLARIEDRNGNYIDFEYDEVALREEFAIRPRIIRYTGNKNRSELSPFAYIEFTYRNETTLPLTKYISGTKLSVKKYLSEIKCYYKPRNQQVPLSYRHYRLEYVNGKMIPGGVIS